MSLFEAFLLGIVQGLTEFVPVSSTAHLILVPWLLQWQIDAELRFAFDVLLQWGTLAAVVVYFWRDLWSIVTGVWRGLQQRNVWANPEARLGWLIVLGTVPAVVVGLLLQSVVKELHHREGAVIGLLAGGGLLLFLSEWLGRGRRQGLAELSWRQALFIGCAQSMALFPGVSRSAATICGALICGLERGAAARFSFLLSVPVLAGAGVVAAADLIDAGGVALTLRPLLVGFVTAAIVGYASIHWLITYLARHSLHAFAWYRLIAGAALLWVWLARRG